MGRLKLLTEKLQKTDASALNAINEHVKVFVADKLNNMIIHPEARIQGAMMAGYEQGVRDALIWVKTFNEANREKKADG